MDEADLGHTTAPTPARAGDRLRAAREAAGLSIADIGARTRIPLRHLEAIEASNYAELPSPTYATGFAKAYARAVGLDEVAVAGEVRADVQRTGRRVPEYEPYEMADPARVPSRGVAIVGLGIALAVLILAGLYFGTDLMRGSMGGGGGGTTADAPPASVVARVPPAAAPSPAAPTGGQVRLAATDEVWLRVYDADNKTLYLGTMKPGETFDVPATANNPQINVGRPDKLTVTLNGSAVPPLGTGERPIKDVPVSGAAIAARLAAPTPTPSPSAASSSAGSSAPARSRRASAPTRPRRVLTETQRANLESARNPPPPAAGGATP